MQSLSYQNNLSSSSDNITSQVYSCIREGHYANAIEILDSKLSHVPNSRPVLSLLAYCCYNNQEYARAAEFYEELVALCPDQEDYQVYYVQSLVMSGAHRDASRVAAVALSRTKSPQHTQRLRLLCAQSQMELGLLSASNNTLSKCADDDPATIIAMAAVDYTEGKYTSALEKYKIAKQMTGDVPMILYYIALCRCRLRDFDGALEDVCDLIEVVGETRLEDLSDAELKESFVVEALNLKAVILKETRDHTAFRETLSRLHDVSSFDSLDSISIHNEIMSSADNDLIGSMQRLSQLLAESSYPPEALSNLMLLCIKHGEDAMAIETFETHNQAAKELLSPDLFSYIESAVLSISRPDDAFEVLNNRIADMAPKLKTAKRKLDDAKAASSASTATRPSTTYIRPNTTARILATSLQESKQEFDTLLRSFIPNLMLQVKLFWDQKDYSKAQELLVEHSEYCLSDNDWNMNLAHTLFAQQNDKLEESIPYYEHVVNRWSDSGELLKAPAVALANLCVSYIMAGQNESAETIIKAVESEEDQREALDDNATPTHHTCLVNLVIGTLYCEKGNYEFGISRICKSLEPFDKNLCADTWFYCKKCLLALASKMSKLMVALDHDVLHDIVDFLRHVELHGTNVIVAGIVEDKHADAQPVTIAQEARQLKNLFRKLRQ
jgi:tetratricopeptide repeat protein 30